MTPPQVKRVAPLLAATLAVLCALAGSTSARAAVVHKYLGSEETSVYTPFPGGSSSVVVDESTSLSDWAKGDTYERVEFPGRKVSEGYAAAGFDVFTPARELVGELQLPGTVDPDFGVFELAIDDVNGDAIVTGQNAASGSVLDIFEPTVLGAWAAPVQLTSGVGHKVSDGAIGVDESSGAPSSGELYVATEYPLKRVEEYSPAGVYLGAVPGACRTAGETPPCGEGDFVPFASPGQVSVDPVTHDLYVEAEGASQAKVVYIFGPDVFAPDVTTGAASELTQTGATVGGTVNPIDEGPASCRFVWGTSRQQLTHTASCGGEVPEGDSPVPVQAHLSGLLPDTEYCYRLEAENKAKGANPGGPNAGEESQDQCFTTPGPADVQSFVTEVSAEAAIVHAEVDPRGAPTSYYVQYGTSDTEACTAQPELCTQAPAAPGVQVGAGVSAVGGEQVAQGLSPGTLYHYRVVEVREAEPGQVEEIDGADRTFTTQTAGGAFVLPDGREYEMVSPPQKQGALFEAISDRNGGEFNQANANGAFVTAQAAAAGDALVDEAHSPTEAGVAGYSNRISVLMTRSADGQWSSQDISPAHDKGGTYTNLGEYFLFSRDLSQGALNPFGDFTPLSPQASESTAYLRSDYLNADVEGRCEAPDLSASSCFTPLVTRADDTSDPFEPFGDELNGTCDFEICGPEFITATPDFSHVIVAAREQLTETPVEIGEMENNEYDKALYEWTDGHLQLVNILPGRTTGGGVQLPEGELTHVVSGNGQRVILASDGDLYLRDVAKGETIPLNAAEGGCGSCVSGDGVYQTANAEDTRIFFLDTNRLTADASASGQDLYECEIVEEAGKDRCQLSDLTPETGGEAASVQSLLGASEDGSVVYFTAGGALAPGAAGEPHCLKEPALGCELYVHTATGGTRFIATITSLVGDVRKEPTGAGHPLLRTMHVRVSPNGNWLMFVANNDVTGYDNRDALSDRSDEELYLYDAGAGSLSCASCDPTGARPQGLEGLAATVPGWIGRQPSIGLDASYQPRYLSNEGRLFFDSAGPLVPKDVNGTVDVYEYEPAGVPAGEHACSPAAQSGSEVYKPARAYTGEDGVGEEGAGCVALISSGSSPEPSTFLDASEDGSDVFFLTTAKLAPQDFDQAYDIYDAQECTAAVPCAPAAVTASPECDTEASCKAPATPQPEIYGAPASATFSGPGNTIREAQPPSSPPPVKKAGAKKTKNKKAKKKTKKKAKKKAKKARRAKQAGRSGKAGRAGRAKQAGRSAKANAHEQSGANGGGDREGRGA